MLRRDVPDDGKLFVAHMPGIVLSDNLLERLHLLDTDLALLNCD
jgi:hypothetical protein